MHSVSEINNLLNNKWNVLGLEYTLKKAITSGATGTTRLHSEQLSTSVGVGGTRKTHTYPPLTPSGDQPETAGIIVTPTDPNMNLDSMKQIIRETIDLKSLKVGVSKMKKLSNNSLFVECNWKGIIQTGDPLLRAPKKETSSNASEIRTTAH